MRRLFQIVGSVLFLLFLGGTKLTAETPTPFAETLLFNGRVATLDPREPFVSAVALQNGRILSRGSDQNLAKFKGPQTKVIDLRGRTVVPGLNDSHIHVLREGLNYEMEIRWEGVGSLKEGLDKIAAQAKQTPAGQWLRVVGGWTEYQFKEKRMPTLEEINAVAPETPVFILHLYDRAWLNRAALKAVGYNKETPKPLGGEIQRDKEGNPTGLLLAKPNAQILYATLAKGPKLNYEDQLKSTRAFMHELNRLGVTSAIDAGGGYQNYPEDYQVIQDLHQKNELTLRIAYNLFTQKPGQELADFQKWSKLVKPGEGDDFLRVNGAGEMLVYSAADFEDFLEPRPELPPQMESELKDVVKFLVQNRWPFRLHATYGESITRFLNVFEEVNREVPFKGLRWFFDHAETISEKDLDRVKALGGGIAVQHRMAYQGEYFRERYGEKQARHAPPIGMILKKGVPLAAGTDATRVAGYNPWISLYWLVSGKTVGGTLLYEPDNRLSRMEALSLWTSTSPWFSGEEGKKGQIVPGQLADMTVLSGDYFSIPEEEIKNLHSVLTIVGGRIVYGADEFATLSKE